nr:hypothetical protein [Tanacetum cinerariifolium]
STSSTTPPTPTPTTTVESAPRLSATAKGKQTSRATNPIEPTDVQRTKAEQLKIGGDEVRESDEEETRQEEEESFDPIPRTPKEKTREEEDENFDPIPRTPEENEEESNDEEEQELRLNTHVTLTPVNPDGPQESSSMSSFMSSMLNPISDVGVESIFTTTSSLIVSLETSTPIMTPSTIATITTSGEAPIPPPTIP